MNQDLIIRDVRLEGSRPVGLEVLEVDANTPIDWPISWTLQKAKFYNSTFVRLRILAHGFEPQTDPGTKILGHTFGDKYSQGGGGIQFCKEGINLTTINKFLPLNGWLD